MPPYSLSSVSFPPSSIFNQLCRFKNSKTISSDGFSPHTLKILGESLEHPLTLLFEFLFSRHYVPSTWKVS